MKLDAMAFGAHVDDIELGCGATMAKLTNAGYSIGACELTAGELSTRGTVEIRQQEAEKAADILGFKSRINLGIPDGNVEESQDNKLKIIKVLREYRPRYVFVVYWKCRHYDHIHASNIVSEACFYSGLKKIDTNQEPHRPSFVLYYPLRHEFNPTFIVDVSDTWETKMEAIKAHRSQFYDPASNEPETYISSEAFLESIIDKMKYWGMRIGVKYGEPFYMKESLRLDDPFSVLNKMQPANIMTTRG